MEECSQKTQQIIDLLYNELPLEDRQSLEAHLIECEACQIFMQKQKDLKKKIEITLQKEQALSLTDQQRENVIKHSTVSTKLKLSYFKQFIFGAIAAILVIGFCNVYFSLIKKTNQPLSVVTMKEKSSIDTDSSCKEEVEGQSLPLNLSTDANYFLAKEDNSPKLLNKSKTMMKARMATESDLSNVSEENEISTMALTSSVNHMTEECLTLVKLSQKMINQQSNKMTRSQMAIVDQKGKNGKIVVPLKSSSEEYSSLFLKNWMLAESKIVEGDFVCSIKKETGEIIISSLSSEEEIWRGYVNKQPQKSFLFKSNHQVFIIFEQGLSYLLIKQQQVLTPQNVE